MSEWPWCLLLSWLLGLVAGGLVASIHEWWHIWPLRKRCWQAEILLAQLRADPDGQALLERLTDPR
jgi:hypothetical protein